MIQSGMDLADQSLIMMLLFGAAFLALIYSFYRYVIEILYIRCFSNITRTEYAGVSCPGTVVGCKDCCHSTQIIMALYKTLITL